MCRSEAEMAKHPSIPGRLGETPPLTVRNGVAGYQFDGVFIPRMAGGADDDPKEADPPKGDDPKGDDDFDKDRALATIRKLRENEKATKAQLKELDDLRAKVKAAEDKDKTEAERLAGANKETADKLTAAEQRAQDLAIRLSVERAARKLGFIDEDDAYRLIDRKAVELDDDGEPTNVDALLTALAKSKPHLVKADGDEKKPPAAQKGTPTTPKPNGKAPTRDELIAEKKKKLEQSGSYARLG
jgi:hypothetical protein